MAVTHAEGKAHVGVRTELKMALPFIVQTRAFGCGPAALCMVCTFLRPSLKMSLEVADRILAVPPGEAVSTISLCTAAVSLGFQSEFYTTHLTFNPQHRNHKFYREHSGTDPELAAQRHILQATTAGVRLVQRHVDLSTLLDLLSPKCAVIVLLDWNVVTNKRESGYWGHFVPVVGYTSDSVIVHNQDIAKPQAFMHITRPVFEEARMADGTDEDICVVKVSDR